MGRMSSSSESYMISVCLIAPSEKQRILSKRFKWMEIFCMKYSARKSFGKITIGFNHTNQTADKENKNPKEFKFTKIPMKTL